MSITAPQLLAVLNLLDKLNSTLAGPVPISLEVNIIRGRFVNAAIHSSSKSDTTLVFIRAVFTKLTSGVCLSNPRTSMEKEYQAIFFPFDKIRRPWLSLNHVATGIEACETFGQRLECSLSPVVHNQMVDHVLFEVRIRKIIHSNLFYVRCQLSSDNMKRKDQADYPKFGF